MKSLWKISIRYILTAVFITVTVLCINMLGILYVAWKSSNNDEVNYFSRELMEKIGQEVYKNGSVYELSEEGYRLFDDTSFIWAMRLDQSGEVIWSYKLPKELPTQYSLADAAVFSRWYIMDYPVYVWRDNDELMVYGCEKNSIMRINLVYDEALIRMLPANILKLLIINIVLIIAAALLFGWRFYSSLRPIAKGIDGLSKKEKILIREKGMTDELAAKLNKASEILTKQDNKLEQRDNARTNWIAGVSHDIRTPLALIIGYSDELAKEDELSETNSKKAGIIREQSLLIKRLIEDLNLTSKLEYDAQPLNEKKFYPAVLIRSCVTDYYNQGLEDKYAIDLKIEPAAEKSELYGDTGFLLRAFRNLIGNSIRHNEDGCSIYISLSCVNEKVLFEFKDTGAGIPKKVVDVLEESPKADDALVHVMGLRIVKQIITAHGGKVSFVKREGGTYDVLLEMPVYKA